VYVAQVASQALLLLDQSATLSDPTCTTCSLEVCKPIIAMPQNGNPDFLSAVGVCVLVEVSAPADLGVVRGWQGPADNPEECVERDHSLWLLAAVHGAYHPVAIQLVDGKRAQVGPTNKLQRGSYLYRLGVWPACMVLVACPLRLLDLLW